MSDNSSSRKKALIISVLAFLFAGGGIFLFFVVQGANDITGAGKKNTFSYGFAVRDAVLPLFKRMGLAGFEEEAPRPRKVELEASGEEAAAPPADVSDWMAQAPAGSAAAPSSRSASPAVVPKMAGRAGSPVGGGAGGSAKSAGGVTRFGAGSSAGMTSVSGKGVAGSQGITEKGTLAALKNSRALLGEGLRSNSAMTASSKWGQSFGVGSGGSGSAGGSLAYNKTGLVNLDKIKSGEISNLKFDKAGGLKTTEVSSPVKDSEGTSKALSADKKLKDDVEAEMKKKTAAAALDGLEGAATKPKTERSDTPPASAPQSGTCDLSAGPPTALCSAALGDSNTMPSDTKVDWKEAGPGPDGSKVYEVTYSGTGPGITDQYKGQPVNYGDTAVMQVDSKGNVTIVEWKTPVETPVPVIR